MVTSAEANRNGEVPFFPGADSESSLADTAVSLTAVTTSDQIDYSVLTELLKDCQDGNYCKVTKVR